MAQRSQPALVRKLKAQRARHRRRSKPVRALIVVTGALVTLAGIALLVLPGPAFVIIPVGLALLALEFAWAERLLDRALRHGATAQKAAAAATPQQKLLTAAAVVLAAVAFVGAALAYDIPLLPV